ncbi:MAG TPA: GNAT family N-acetyltransferase [Aggregatilineaceae bacterium]|nr:GNAT family N-acetyltransferase [Aggregatilineaceae bacterium]
MDILTFTYTDPHWPAYLAHLERVNMARWATDEGGLPKPGVYYLGAWDHDQVVGNLSLKWQPIVIPATDWSGGHPAPLLGPDGEPLHETFVNTFAVEEAHQRQGYGRALQLAALDLTRDLGGYQMRSWSSLDKSANYALKLSLGFSAHPEIQEAYNGQKISGVYFIKKV